MPGPGYVQGVLSLSLSFFGLADPVLAWGMLGVVFSFAELGGVTTARQKEPCPGQIRNLGDRTYSRHLAHHPHMSVAGDFCASAMHAKTHSNLALGAPGLKVAWLETLLVARC